MTQPTPAPTPQQIWTVTYLDDAGCVLAATSHATEAEAHAAVEADLTARGADPTECVVHHDGAVVTVDLDEETPGYAVVVTEAPTPAPAPAPTVWVVTYNSHDGADASVHATEASALETAADWRGDDEGWEAERSGPGGQGTTWYHAEYGYEVAVGPAPILD